MSILKNVNTELRNPKSLNLDKMAISDHFELIYARDTLDYMKPDPKSFLQVQKDVLDRENITTSYKFHFYDDQLNNLNTAFQLGWNTIWIHPRFKETYKYYFVNQSSNILGITR